MAHTVFVGLSGGVDSSVSAALLKGSGHNVVGAFIKIWQPEFYECTWQRDRLDAMRVAAALSIPFREIDLSAEYKKEVIAQMLDAYRSGATPNPDVLCNHSIKFGSFMTWARAEGADAVATGHYARVQKRLQSCELLRGADASKDQSYFLHLLSKNDLARVIFPVGELMKSQVRSYARSYALPIAEKPDSQGLCFVGDVSMRDFLRRYIDVTPGIVRDMSGRKIGTHDGAALYTVGQRHGFEVHGEAARSPLYITRIQPETNELYVSADKTTAYRKQVRIQKMHWIQGVEPTFPARFDAQARYRETPVSVTVTRDAEGVLVEFDEPHLISPGQSLVLYDGDVCKGGGVMSRENSVHSSEKKRAVAIQ